MSPKPPKKRSIQRVVSTLVLLVLTLVLLWSVRLGCNQSTSPTNGSPIPATPPDSQPSPPHLRDTLGSSDTLSSSDTVHSAPFASKKPTQPRVKPPARLPSPPSDSLESTQADSTAPAGQLGDGGLSELDTTSALGCGHDTIAPWVYADPSGGLHRKRLQVRLIADKICSIQWRLDPAEPWLPYNTAQTIAIDSTATLYYRAQDSCANELETQQERYVIKPQSAAAPCPGDMEQVSVGGSSFCIDRYEWPNRRGARPLSYISFYQAMDSCYGVGKRLCSADEWKIACSGPSNWDYPYGQRYEKRACTTQDTMLHLSGSKPACRGYFDVYDLSGNLLEWTSSKASENTLFYYVMGGFWQSGPQSGCFDTRYSYFPQNRHNPVGFRCCRDSANHGQ